MSLQDISHVSEFFGLLRKNQFVAFVNDQGQPVIRDQLNRKRNLPDELLQYAKSNRNAIVAALNGQNTWLDEHGDDRCRQCNCIVNPQHMTDSVVTTCLFKPQCPFWRLMPAHELAPWKDPTK